MVSRGLPASLYTGVTEGHLYLLLLRSSCWKWSHNGWCETLFGVVSVCCAPHVSFLTLCWSRSWFEDTAYAELNVAIVWKDETFRRTNWFLCFLYMFCLLLYEEVLSEWQHLSFSKSGMTSETVKRWLWWRHCDATIVVTINRPIAPSSLNRPFIFIASMFYQSFSLQL